MNTRLYVVLSISPQQLIQYYEGHASTVVAKTKDGRTIRFPASVLRSLVQGNGVQGLFELVIDVNHKLVSIKRVDNS
ncbi:DUF2835 domain-containing protein [Nitrosomonas marina]|uniref:DUF2835 domain-containing protein n=1 Tax=Nitrosomonas marina TaxID=917 RepID=A0A1H8IXU6_9PROT|nr:DUF2835 domain-containing protein [Nitrosomonas marina]SEN72508.1 Protein of unknown function [Nitrosomonas marina]